MTESWKKWEGQVIHATFPLHEYLGGAEDRAVFLTSYGEPSPQRAVIKIVLGNPESTESQLQRWHIAANLSHPNLIRIFTTGSCELEGTPLIYEVMEYADENLASVIPNRPLTAEEAREMLEPVLNALAYVHSQGLVHGHLKPANILAVGSCLKISSDGVYRSGERIPAPRNSYTAPEIGGSSPAIDVWSLGMTLVETMTQVLPVWGQADQHEPVIPETLPEPFLEIARHCLRSDPRQRWTVAEINARLLGITPTPPEPDIAKKAGDESPVDSSPVEKAPVEKRPVASLKWIYGLAALIGLGISAVVITPRLLNFQTTAPQPSNPAPPVQPDQRGVQSKPGQGANTSSGAPSNSAPPPAPAAASVPSEIVQRVLPTVPATARHTIQGAVKVRVRVHVDSTGTVQSAELDSPGPSKYFAQLALQAAQSWKFNPAKSGGRAVPSEWTLRFEFLRNDTRVVAQRARPL